MAQLKMLKWAENSQPAPGWAHGKQAANTFGQVAALGLCPKTLPRAPRRSVWHRRLEPRTLRPMSVRR